MNLLEGLGGAIAVNVFVCDMALVGHYRNEARHCRKQAALEPSSRHVTRWLAIAGNYERVADELEKRWAADPSTH